MYTKLQKHQEFQLGLYNKHSQNLSLWDFSYISLHENNLLSSVDEQAGQIKDMSYEDNLQAKNAFTFVKGS